MKLLISLIALASALCLVSAAATKNSGRGQYNAGQYNAGQYNPGQYDNYYNNRYYKNREYYNQRRYYDNFFKQYNPNVVPQEARIVEQSVEPAQEDGTFAYSYETENGIHNEARGTTTKLGTDEQAQRVEGSFSFITPDGLRVGVRYIADENGYRPIITYDGVKAEQFTRAQPPADVKITKIH